MHKFTIFTIILSVMVIMVVADLVLNDYMGNSQMALEESTPVVGSVVDPELRGDEGEAVVTDDVETVVIDDETENSDLVDSEFVSDVVLDEMPVPVGLITPELIASFNLLEPRLETEIYDGLLYGFWEMTDDFSNFTILEHKIFDGPNFMASLYEIQGENEIQAFAAYEALRQIALTSPLGDLNENNSYGDASFYFNHSTKMNTVYMIVRKGLGVYAFQYGHDVHHTLIRPMIEALGNIELTHQVD